MSVAFVAVIAASAIILFLFPDVLLNNYIKGKIIAGVSKANPAYTLDIARARFKLFENRLELDSVTLTKSGSTFAASLGSFAIYDFNRTTFLLKGTVFPQAGENSFVDADNIVLNIPGLKNELPEDTVTHGIATAAPSHSIRINHVHYSSLENRFTIDSLQSALSDSSFFSTISLLSVGGLNRIASLFEGTISPEAIINSGLDARAIVMTFPKSQYELDCEELHVSVPDSEVMVHRLKFYPSVNNEKFFAQTKFRRLRYNLAAPETKVRGIDFVGLLQGKLYRARSVYVHDATLDFLINKDKPNDKTVPLPTMPQKLLSSLKKTLEIDTLHVTGGQIQYREQKTENSTPGVLTFDNVEMLAKGIAHHADMSDTVAIAAQGLFMNTSAMKILMVIPVSRPTLTFRCSGSFGAMDLKVLNPYLQITQYRRIKSGILHQATFDFTTTNGHASGSVWESYDDLAISVLNKNTGSDKGFMDRVFSAIGKIFVVRDDNLPVDDMKVGTVNYSKMPDETFLQFAWYALRSGVGNVVGF